MKKLNQQGIAHPVVVVVVALVLAGIGYGGYRVYDSNQKTKKSLGNTSQTKEKNLTTNTPDVTQKTTSNNFDCDGKFTLSVPKDWFSFRLENGGNCTISSTKQSELPAVGTHTGENVSFVFSTFPDTTLGLDAWADKFFKDKETYPETVISKETIKFDNGQSALLVLTEGGHYSTKDYNLFYKKGSLGIITDWDSTSKLSDKALEVVKTIN